ncbi:hypothetical protein VmeM32_00261 [Vibrio phage vB_VmeM-32]|nr:hypothetical protein VmeM32_00261 [Vibrio phage vB_VmeM-32]
MWIKCTKDEFQKTIENQEYTRVSNCTEHENDGTIEVIYSNRYRPVCRYTELDEEINYFYWI